VELSPILIKPESSLKDAITAIDIGSLQIAIVVDEYRKLLGIVTDGDVRRAILRGVSLDINVTNVMTHNPYVLHEGFSRNEALSLMRNASIHQLPILDEVNRVVDVFAFEVFLEKKSFSNPVVIMAGGKGERLGSLTKNCPKPMLEVNGKPIMEIILEKCIDAGFNNFYFSVNYLKDKIIDHFGVGEKWGVNISYLEEKKPLGTCGSLTLLPNDLADDILVLNGDVLTDLEYDRLMTYHQKSRNAMTVCTRSHRVRIPFAVMTSSEAKLEKFVEKPMYEFQVNAGVYILTPSLIEKIPSKFYNMTDLVDDLLDSKSDVGVFPIHENWKDIGSPIDFREAVQSFQ
jgi:dTDP-glucose pyrophosphorylase/predicted transcriptional regulator